MKPTASIIRGIIKHDHYYLNGLNQGELSLANIKKDLSKLNLDDADLELLELINTDQMTYKALGLPSFLKRKL